MCVLRQFLSIHQLIESMLGRSWMRRRRLTVAGNSKRLSKRVSNFSNVRFCVTAPPSYPATVTGSPEIIPRLYIKLEEAE